LRRSIEASRATISFVLYPESAKGITIDPNGAVKTMTRIAVVTVVDFRFGSKPEVSDCPVEVRSTRKRTSVAPIVRSALGNRDRRIIGAPDASYW